MIVGKNPTRMMNQHCRMITPLERPALKQRLSSQHTHAKESPTRVSGACSVADRNRRAKTSPRPRRRPGYRGAAAHHVARLLPRPCVDRHPLPQGVTETTGIYLMASQECKASAHLTLFRSIAGKRCVSVDFPFSVKPAVMQNVLQHSHRRRSAIAVQFLSHQASAHDLERLGVLVEAHKPVGQESPRSSKVVTCYGRDRASAPLLYLSAGLPV